jgi:hypothetical protein
MADHHGWLHNEYQFTSLSLWYSNNAHRNTSRILAVDILKLLSPCTRTYMEISVFWHVISCSQVEIYRLFGGIWYFHTDDRIVVLYSFRISFWRGKQRFLSKLWWISTRVHGATSKITSQMSLDLYRVIGKLARNVKWLPFKFSAWKFHVVHLFQ